MKREFIEAAADAVGAALAEAKREWQREREISEAQHREAIAVLRAVVVERCAEIGELSRVNQELVAKLVEQATGVVPDIEEHVDRKVWAFLAELPGPKDGERGIDGKDGAPGRDGIDGKDGTDGIDGRDGAPGRDGVDGKDGAPGRDGIDGKDGTDGIDGRDGPPGERGPEGPPGKFSAPRLWSKGIHYESALVLHDGSTYCAMKDTAEEPPHEDWAPVAVKGRDAAEWNVCGLYDPGGTYHKGDVVTHGGSEWRARRDGPGELPGDGWALSASKGKRGDRGERGERGLRGEHGADGISLIDVVVDGFEFKFVLSDGSILSRDVTPMFQAYREMAR